MDCEGRVVLDGSWKGSCRWFVKCIGFWEARKLDRWWLPLLDMCCAEFGACYFRWGLHQVFSLGKCCQSRSPVSNVADFHNMYL